MFMVQIRFFKYILADLADFSKKGRKAHAAKLLLYILSEAAVCCHYCLANDLRILYKVKLFPAETITGIAHLEQRTHKRVIEAFWNIRR